MPPFLFLTIGAIVSISGMTWLYFSNDMGTAFYAFVAIASGLLIAALEFLFHQ